MAHLEHSIQALEVEIQKARAIHQECSELLRHYRSREWEAIATDLAKSARVASLAVRDYRGSDWREIGCLQGECRRLDHILGAPDRLAEQLKAAEATIRTKLQQQQRLQQGAT